MGERPHYNVIIQPLPDEEGGGFVATVPDLPGCMSDGETEFEAVQNVQDAIECWIEAAEENNRPIPAPSHTTRRGERSMRERGLDGRHRDKNGGISTEHGDTQVGTLRKIYGKGFAAGYSDTTRLREVLHQLNETSLSELRRDHDIGHLGHKISQASK